MALHIKFTNFWYEICKIRPYEFVQKASNSWKRLLDYWNRTHDGVILAKIDLTSSIGGELGSVKHWIISLTYVALDGLA